MLVDGRSLPSATRLRAQLCIVGTGMGALSVANDLIAAGIDILFIETGALTPQSRAARLESEEVGRPFRLGRSRGLEVGGGTGFWHGICAELDETDFGSRDWIPHSGWPIGRGDLSKAYQQAWRFLCGAEPSDLPGDQVPLFAAPERLHIKPYRFRSPPFRGRDMLLAWCREGRARCVTHATGLQVIFDDVGTARQLAVGSGDRVFIVEADNFILATGALETPRLLLNSQVASGRDWRDLWWLGRNLIDHPAAYVSQLVFRRPMPARGFSGSDGGGGLKTLPGYVIDAPVQQSLGLPNHTVFVRPGPNGRKRANAMLMSFLGIRSVRDLRPGHVRALISDRHIRWRIAHQRLGLGGRTRFGDLFFMTEQLPNPLSRVDLSDRMCDRFGFPRARVSWQLSGDDVRLFERTMAVVAEAFGRHADVQGVRADGIADWLASVSSGAHHLGTMRMAASPASGVVDVNQRVFGTTNLWISDGSVFPTAGSVNPSLTICALGHRLAAHLLAGRLRPQPSGSRTAASIPAAMAS